MDEREASPWAAGSDLDIDRLLEARAQIDAELRRHKSSVTVMFTDIVGSTAFFERHGDTAGVAMLQGHNQLVIPVIEACRGRPVKTIGDSVMALFQDAADAVLAAVTIQKSLFEFNADRPRDERLHVRIGLNRGVGFLREGDIFGDMVNVAARIVKVCGPAQILTSASVYEHVSKRPGVMFVPAGQIPLKGKAEPESVYEVVWTEPETYRKLRAALRRAAKSPGEARRIARYEIREEIGRGGMGVVYRAFDPVLGRTVALKTMRLDAPENERAELMRRLRAEAKAAAVLDHPNIVTIHDLGEDQGLFFFTMQWIKGHTLQKITEQRTLLPVEQVVPIFSQVCEALHYAHQHGVIHRDLKPSNIILTEERVPKILDFGIAKITTEETTRARGVVGTPAYMSPEQASGRRVDGRADLFSAGAILYEILTGERAFPGESYTTVLYKILNEEPVPVRYVEPSVSPALEVVVRRALAKDLLHRFQTGQEMAAELRQAGLTVLAVSQPRTGNCGKCGTPLIPGALFCGECGSPVR